VLQLWRAGTGQSGKVSETVNSVALLRISIQSTVRYTELAPNRFKNLWRT
jgi:hypothetical protein